MLNPAEAVIQQCSKSNFPIPSTEPACHGHSGSEPVQIPIPSSLFEYLLVLQKVPYCILGHLTEMWLCVQARAVLRVLHTGALSQRTTGLKSRWICLDQAQRSLGCTFSALLSIEILLLQNIWSIASPSYTLPIAFSTTIFIRMWEHNKTLNCTKGVTVKFALFFFSWQWWFLLFHRLLNLQSERTFHFFLL